ncbi:speckle-type POZ protein [Fopius arisanus]|uniref:Speckle-type POZ protein n=1 Tax=Fopius arisanus TaxID=64838 RepID=A0A0C9RLB2_9HYME|nr:PREDICTED: speckle-type POZ protein-like [Fopius arisanus]
MSPATLFVWFLAAVSISHSGGRAELFTISSSQYAVSDLQAEHLSYEWTIQNLTLMSKNKQCFQSPHFRTANKYLTWGLELCSDYIDSNRYNGYDNRYNGFIKLYTFPSKDSEDLIISGSLKLLNSENIIINEVFKSQSVGPEKPIKYPYSLSKSEVRVSSDFNSTVTVHCEIDMPLKAISKVIDGGKSQNQKTQRSELSRDYSVLLNQGNFSDMTIIVEGERLSAHKAILSARSPVFATLFDNSKNETTQVKIDNTEVAVVRAMLEYIYTGDVENLKEFLLIHELLATADKFKLFGLKSICGDILSKNLNAENVADVMVLSDVHGIDQLKKLTIEFIKKHFEDVMVTEGYKKLKEKSPALLMEILFSSDKRF